MTEKIKVNVSIDGKVCWSDFSKLSKELDKINDFDFILHPTLEQHTGFEKEKDLTYEEEKDLIRDVRHG